MHYKKLVKRHKTQEKQKMEKKWWHHLTAYQIYTRSFTEYKLGYGSAIAMVLSIFVLLFTFLSFRFGSQSNDTGN